MLERLKRAARFLADCHIAPCAASASFFITLSVFPLLALVLSLLRYLPVGPEDLLEILANILPEALMPLVKFLFNDLYSANTAAVVSLTAVIAVWSASHGVFDLLNGVSYIVGGEETRSWFRRRFLAILYTAFLILAVLLSLGLQVFGQSLLDLAARWDLQVYRLLSRLLRLRWLFTALVLALLFMLIFAFFPARTMRLRNVLPGAVFTSLGWLAFSFLFSIYVNHGGGSRFYGSMATGMLALLWLYFCMTILFYGAVLCRMSLEGYLTWDAIKTFFSKKAD